MTPPHLGADASAEKPLPAFPRPGPGTVSHPVLAAVLAEVEEREASGEAGPAYYSDAADPR
ncbi:hypothetical protein QIS99_06985 [Streptomyces sp. B-S-A8]|uniref:Uncharacterized protein n=1 Tax=Streptomyces solicavernae TaxID=3043614 RepID=A0ABT6RNF9_9ACTN|nr:hypothetical protein [Streptomyces sp. B-S-A8]MDI3385964.1 hypothetical protein [Streptomyces sp. B-S-A8]